MFCNKCGSQIVEDAAFCQKCGAKLIADKAVSQQSSAPVASSPQLASIHSVEPKKKSKKLLFGLVGIGIAVVVIAAIVIMLNMGGGGKYPDELLYEGLPVARFLEMTRDDVIAEFGEPDQTDSSYPGIRYDDKGITMINFSEETGKVIYMNFYTSGNCTFNGKKFTNKTAEDAIKILSTSEGKMGTGLTTIDYSMYSQIAGAGSQYKFFRILENDYTLEFVTISSGKKDLMLSIFLCLNASIPDDIAIPEQRANTTTLPQGDTTSPSSDARANSGEVLYESIPLSQFLGEPIQTWIDTFGEPDYDNYWFVTYEGEFDLIVDVDHPRAINSIQSITPSMVEINGVTLDKTRAELVSTFGEPSREYFDEGYGDTFTPGFNYIYDLEGYSFTVTCENDGDKPYAVSVHPTYDYSGEDDGGYEEDYYSYQTPEMDANLLGRWRSDDGSRLELRENGSFSIPWNLSMPVLCTLDLNNAYWESNNGRITISYHYNHHPRLDGFEIDPDSGTECMTLGLVSYYRCDISQNGTGLVGEWGGSEKPERYTEPILVFREDYTGRNADKEFTWMMSSGSPLMTYAATSSVDYTVYGDFLTIYFTDGSKVFTRVGN